MSALFIYSCHFKIIDGKYYSIGGVTDEVLRRYVTCFGNTTILANVCQENSLAENYTLIHSPGMIIKDFKSLSDDELKELVKSNDAIILRFPCGAAEKAASMAMKMGKPYFAEIVGCPWDAFWNHSWKGKVIALPCMLKMKHVVKHAAYACYVTDQFLQSRYPSNGQMAGISDVQSEIVKEEELAQRISVSCLKNKEVIKVGSVGAIYVAYKGYRFVVRALAILKQRGICNIEYHLVGSGDQSKLKAEATKCGVADQVIFHGIVKHADMPFFLDKMDLFVQPSLQEGLCRALVEAMSRGVPCIATKAGGNPELIEEKYLVSTNKRTMPQEIADQIEKMIRADTLEPVIRQVVKRAADFDGKILDSRRQAFMNEYREYIKKNAGNTSLS